MWEKMVGAETLIIIYCMNFQLKIKFIKITELNVILILSELK